MQFYRPEKELPDWIKLTPLNGVIILIISIVIIIHNWIMGDFDDDYFDMTLDEIAKIEGVSRQRVDQIGGVFLTHEQLAEIKYNSECSVFNMIEQLSKYTEKREPKDNKREG